MGSAPVEAVEGAEAVALDTPSVTVFSDMGVLPGYHLKVKAGGKADACIILFAGNQVYYPDLPIGVI